MMDVSDIYYLNPDYILKSDVDKCILYSKKNVNSYSSASWKSCIHPVQAMILSFFTHKRTMHDNLCLISDLVGLPYEELFRMISLLVENQDVKVCYYKNEKIFFPKYLLVNQNKIHTCSNSPKYNLVDFKLKSKLNLSNRRINSNPLELTFMLTNRCATRCIYCYADTTTKVKNYMPIERIYEIIDEACDLQMTSINVIGGEIFLHKYWDKILNYLVKKDFQPDIISTKLPITDDIAQKIKDSGYQNRIQFSLDSLEEDILYEMVHANRGYLEKVKEGFEILEKKGISFQIATILTQYNSDEKFILEMYDYFKNFSFLKQWELRPVMMSIYKDYNVYNRIKVEKKNIDVLYKKLKNKDLLSEKKFNLVLNNDLIDKEFYNSSQGSRFFKGAKCSALNRHLFILPDGKATICEQLYWNPNFIIGDLNNSSIVDVWNSKKALSLFRMQQDTIQDSSACKQCALFDACFGLNNRCWADIIKAYGEKSWDYPDPRCSFAPKMTYELNYK